MRSHLIHILPSILDGLMKEIVLEPKYGELDDSDVCFHKTLKPIKKYASSCQTFNKETSKELLDLIQSPSNLCSSSSKDISNSSTTVTASKLKDSPLKSTRELEPASFIELNKIKFRVGKRKRRQRSVSQDAEIQNILPSSPKKVLFIYQIEILISLF